MLVGANRLPKGRGAAALGLIVAGIWLIAQVTAGQALQRLGIVK